FTLGKLDGSRQMNALAKITAQHENDPWFRVAILSSVHDSPAQFFKLLLTEKGALDNADFLSQLASLIGGKHDPREIGLFLSSLPSMKQPEAGLSGLAKGMKLVGVKSLRVPGAEDVLKRFLDSPSESVQKAAWETARYLELRALVQKAGVD